jgi:hypothetical protein
MINQSNVDYLLIAGAVLGVALVAIMAFIVYIQIKHLPPRKVSARKAKA